MGTNPNFVERKTLEHLGRYVHKVVIESSRIKAKDNKVYYSHGLITALQKSVR